MPTQNDFFTAQSLLTFGGATLATFLVPNALQRAMNFNPRWLAFSVAEAICLIIVINQWWQGVATSPVDFVVAFVNGCLVFCSAVGATSIGAGATEGELVPKTAKEYESPERHKHGHEKIAKPERGFFSPWF